MRVSDIRTTNIEEVLHQFRPVTRNRMLSFLNNLFNLFETWNFRPRHSNPCHGLHYARETPRDRTLTRNEFHRLGAAYRFYETTRPVHVAALRIATLSGLRISEVLAIHWDHIDFNSGRLVLPDTKTGRRQHDLPPPAMDILQTLRELHSKPYVFPTIHGQMTYTPLCRFFRKCTEHAQLHDVRIHDLRRSVITQAASANLNSHIVRDLLGHRNAQTADRYIREVGGPVRDARHAIGIDIHNMISETIAVGTLVSQRPPHRSGRARQGIRLLPSVRRPSELSPHKRRLAHRRGREASCDTLTWRSVQYVLRIPFLPLAPVLPSTDSAEVATPLCSPASTVL